MTEPTVEPLITKCPQCNTNFRVTTIQLDKENGQVRCGVCKQIFLATDSLAIGENSELGDEFDVADLDDLLEELGTDHDSESDADSEFLASFEPEAEPAQYTQSIDEALKNRIYKADLGAQSLTRASNRVLAETGPDENESEDEDEDNEALEHPHIRAQLPDLLPSPERTVGQILRPFFIGVALVLVVAQVLWFQFDEWAVDPTMRPIYAQMCEVILCTLPARRSLKELFAKNVVVRPHANNPDLLVVDAIIVNNADFPQRFPLIDMRFTSVNGILILGRKIRPVDYLSGDAVGMLDIDSHAPVHVRFEIGNPGPDGPNFDLKLL